VPTYLFRKRPILLLANLVLLLIPASSARGAEALRVCVTTPDARAIVEAVGGDAISVVGLVDADQDAHVVQPTRGMVEALADADLLVVVGNGLEDAWLPRVLAQADNSALRPGEAGFLDLSENVRALTDERDAGETHDHGHSHGHDHSHGHGGDESFHGGGNPHYLLDPIEGVKAAAALSGRLSELAPESSARFEQAYRDFALEIMRLMIGPELTGAIGPDDFEAAAIAIENDVLDEYLAVRGVSGLRLVGVLGGFAEHRGTPVIGDHDYWTYAARRYGLDVLGYLEPEPGIPPTPKHLQNLIAEMKERGASVILTIKRFDPRHARLVSRATNGVVVPMADVPGSRPETEIYVDFVRYNASVLLEALERESR